MDDAYDEIAAGVRSGNPEVLARLRWIVTGRREVRGGHARYGRGRPGWSWKALNCL